MRSFGTYISKQLASFSAFLLLLLLLNAALFGATFYKTVAEDYGTAAPRAMLELAAGALTPDGLSEQVAGQLQQNQIWALYLTPDGQCAWSLDRPKEIPQSYTLQDVALFSRGYLADYPVFIQTAGDGLLVLGYPKGSYTKLTSNYYPLRAVRRFPLYAAGMLALDVLCLFFAYCFSKRHILRSTAPIVAAVEALAEGRPVSVCAGGEFSEIAASLCRASRLLSRQNEARANWISGVSHDIRTPLSMILGYADRIAADPTASPSVRQQAGIVRRQSVRIKELVRDLNLVSQLEYDMQPLHKEPVRLARLIRSCVAGLLNDGLPDLYTVELQIAPEAEAAVLDCDARLIDRALNNLVHNSIQHNPQGCGIQIFLERAEKRLILTVADDGAGLSPETLHALEQTPHYMERTDGRLDLRHGLGLLLVRQIAAAHKGSFTIENLRAHGCKAVLTFQLQ